MLAQQWRSFNDAERSAALRAVSPAGSVGRQPDLLPDQEASHEEFRDLWDCGDHGWPLRADVLNGYVHSHPAHAAAGIAGVARKAERIREFGRGSLVVHNEDAAMAGRVYSHRHSCSEAHPGLCAFHDAAVYPNALKRAKSRERCLDRSFSHRFCCIADPDRPSANGMFLYLARLRPRRFHSQATHVLARCVQHHEGGCLSLGLGQRRFRLWDFVSLWTVAKELLGSGARRLQVHRTPTCSRALRRA